MEITFEGSKKVIAHLNGHKIITDQPLKAGGENSAPTPFELFLASIGTCAGIYVKNFCDGRNIPSDHIRIEQTMDYDRITGLPTDISIEVILPPDFPEKYKEAVIHAAGFCKVKKTIANPPDFNVTARMENN